MWLKPDEYWGGGARNVSSQEIMDIKKNKKQWAICDDATFAE